MSLMSLQSLMSLWFLLFLVAPLRAVQPETEDPPAALAPGLPAIYSSLSDPSASVTKIDSKPAFYVANGSPHPRLPAGPFEVFWRGQIVWRENEPVSFFAFVCGEASIVIDGKEVLAGRGESLDSRVDSNKTFQREPGTYAIQVRFRSIPHSPARLQIWWQGDQFSAEPLAAWHLKHLPQDVPDSYRRDAEHELARRLAGQYGCAQCHSAAMPAIDDPPPGPVLKDLHQRTTREWLLSWLDDPSRLRASAHMPQMFSNDRQGFLERWLIAEHLLTKDATTSSAPEASDSGDHRMGRRLFVSLGCGVCHFLPDMNRDEQLNVGQHPFEHLADRWPAAALTSFISDVHRRYPDDRMPQIPVKDDEARDIAAYLLLWSTPSQAITKQEVAPNAEELAEFCSKREYSTPQEAARGLFESKGCTSCHPSQNVNAVEIPLHHVNSSRGCLSNDPRVRFRFSAEERDVLRAYLQIAVSERHASPFAERQAALDRARCTACHQRDMDLPPPIERVGATLGGAWLQRIPYQRTPRLSFAHQKYARAHLLKTVRESVKDLRHPEFSYRMPLFADRAEMLVQALAEADGDVPIDDDTQSTSADPTIGSLEGPDLAGFQGYSCVGCHVWNGDMLADPDPAAIGPDLTRTVGRIRRPWFDRMLENPLRLHPGIPMPAVFPHGKPALLDNVLDGSADRQRDALWNYFALGKDAPNPKPAPPMLVKAPPKGKPLIAALIPLHLESGPIESLCLLFNSHDLVVYDLNQGAVVRVYQGAQIQRTVNGRIRRFMPSSADPPFNVPQLEMYDREGEPTKPDRQELLGYENIGAMVVLKRAMYFGEVRVTTAETLSIVDNEAGHQLFWDIRLDGPARFPFQILDVDEVPTEKEAIEKMSEFLHRRITLPAPKEPAPIARAPVIEAGRPESNLRRPGYQAFQFQIPQSEAGEDLIMPSAVAVMPRTGRTFIASMKLGELFELTNPLGDGSNSEFRDFGNGLFQEAYSMTADDDALYILHRRNLTKIRDTNNDGVADRFDRVAGLPHGIADSYDYAYGLARDPTGGFVFGYAPYASRSMAGSGGAIRINPKTSSVKRLAYGMRNPVGWCAGPDQQVFFTDNQGEWVATNKLCHVMEDHYYGFPNDDQGDLTKNPRGRTAIWVPYAWAHSINGVTYDSTGGKFGPFAGQFFLAELMFGGAIIRANVENVNGQYQGACFPFWSRGLLGPLTMTFHPNGHLFVGSVTEPGWMAQPDRGGFYRIDYTGDLPFEMQSIHVLPQGFRIQFTRPVELRTAEQQASYRIESYRYEYTSSYGSPELDRMVVPIERLAVAPDGMSVKLSTSPLVTDRVYMITASGVRSSTNEPLVHDTGAYTLNEVPASN